MVDAQSHPPTHAVEAGAEVVEVEEHRLSMVCSGGSLLCFSPRDIKRLSQGLSQLLLIHCKRSSLGKELELVLAEISLEGQNLGRLHLSLHSRLALLRLAHRLHCFLVCLLHLLQGLQLAVLLLLETEHRLGCELEHVALRNPGGG